MTPQVLEGRWRLWGAIIKVLHDFMLNLIRRTSFPRDFEWKASVGVNNFRGQWAVTSSSSTVVVVSAHSAAFTHAPCAYFGWILHLNVNRVRWVFTIKFIIFFAGYVFARHRYCLFWEIWIRKLKYYDKNRDTVDTLFWFLNLQNPGLCLMTAFCSSFCNNCA